MAMKTVACTTGLFFLVWFAAHAQIADTIAEKKMNIAVLTLKNTDGVTAGEAEIISDRLNVELFNTGNVNIMERTEMKSILSEQGLQQSGTCNDAQCMIEIGKILGVQGLVAGSIGKVGSLYLLNLRLIDVQSGRVSKVISRDLNGMEIVVNYLPDISKELVGPTAAIVPAPQPQPAPTEIQETDSLQAPVATPAPQAPAEAPTSAQAPTPALPPPTPEIKPEEQTPSIRPNSRSILMGVHLGGIARKGATMLKLSDRSPAVTFNDGFDKVTSQPVIMPNLGFVMHVKRFILIEAGIGYGFWEQNYHVNVSSYTLDQTESYKMLSITGGVGISIPVSIMFLNVDLRGGYSLLNNTEKSTITTTTTTTTSQNGSSVLYNIQTGVGAPEFGGRAGIEIFVSEHFSLTIDLLFTYTKFKTATMNYDTKVWGVSRTETLEIVPPLMGGESGMNFYF